MKKKTVIALRAVFAAVALCFIGVGVMHGEFIEVLQKAVRVCLECIGIG